MTNRPMDAEPSLRTEPRFLPRSPAELLEPMRAPLPPKRSRAVRVPREPREPRRMGGFLRFINGVLSLVFLALLTVGGLAFFLRNKIDEPGPLAANGVAIIRLGEGVDQIASRLEREGIISSSLVFLANYRTQQLNAFITGDKPVQLKAGEYEIKKASSTRQVFEVLREGRTILAKVTMPEGLTSQQIVERLKADQSLGGDISTVPPEGSLLPDTYRFARGVSRGDVLERMQAEMRRQLAVAWTKRQPNLPFKTIEEALVLASIVEKETGRADERDKVAAVFVNRLRKGMRLESDPTIVYGIVGGQGALGRALTKSDIETKTAFNTYRIDGLPPTPICNPGLAAIRAVLNPAQTNDLFFVADGSGGHTFTTNYKDHLAAVANWRRVERARQVSGGAAAPPVQAPGAQGAPLQAAQPQAPPQPQPPAQQAPQQAAPAPQQPAAQVEPRQVQTTDIPLPIRKPKRQ